MIELVIRVIILFNYMFTNYYDDIYQFKLENIDDLSELFEILNKDSIVINDPIGIQEIYKKYPDYLTRHRYIQRNYKKFKKKINN